MARKFLSVSLACLSRWLAAASATASARDLDRESLVSQTSLSIRACVLPSSPAAEPGAASSYATELRSCLEPRDDVLLASMRRVGGVTV